MGFDLLLRQAQYTPRPLRRLSFPAPMLDFFVRPIVDMLREDLRWLLFRGKLALIPQEFSGVYPALFWMELLIGANSYRSLLGVMFSITGTHICFLKLRSLLLLS